MLILSRDPGQKPGVAVLDGTGTVLWAGLIAPAPAEFPVGFDVAITEGQWWYPDSDTDPNRLFKLSFEAGWSLAQIQARRYLLVQPSVWRSTSSAKEKVQRRIARDLTPAERRLFHDIPAKRHGDVLDAIGIGRGGIKVLDQTKYDWPPIPQPRKSRAAGKKRTRRRTRQ